MSSPRRSPRHVLSDRTNQPNEPSCSTPSENSRGKRPADGHESDKKRLKLLSSVRENKSSASDGNEDVQMLDLQRVPLRRQSAGVYGMLKSMRTGNPFPLRHFAFPTTRVLESFVSSNKSDLYKCHSIEARTFLTPPYACAFTQAAKLGRSSTLAVATEQGTVDIINTTGRRDWEAETPRTTLQIHNNGIFDIKWSPTDAFFATASGDRSVRVTDPQSSSGSPLHILTAGHLSTVKCVAWDPNHNDLLASGGRDGTICLWDIRDRRRGSAEGAQEGLNSIDGVRPIMTISYAHEVTAGKPAKKGRTILAPKTVTSLVYISDSPYKLLSSGAADGIVRKWDMRFIATSPSKRSKKPAPILPIDDAVIDFTTISSESGNAGIQFSPRRARGISSLALGLGPTAGCVFALGNDSRVHTYNSMGAAGVPLDIQQSARTYTHKHMATNSFYVRIGVSPCGRWLASGAAGGSAFVFDVSDRISDITQGVELKGQEGEVGALDWADQTLATCADDGTVRIWRPDLERHIECLQNPEEAKWDWSWGRM